MKSPLFASMPTEVLAYIGLGANLGHAHATLVQALDALRASPKISALRVSSLYRSAPVDADGGDYLNAVAEVRTSMDATTLLRTLHTIENAHGRQRPYRNAPRTLDLDLLWYNAQTIALPNLQVPHPRMHTRAFVLLPLRELAPDLRIAGAKLNTWLDTCTDQRIERIEPIIPASRHIQIA